LAAGDFSPELTTSVIWLNKHELDITCIRLKPYRLGDRLLVDVTQIIPLPEAADYEIKVRTQEKETKKARSARQEIFRRFWAQFIERSRRTTQLFANRSTSSDHWLSAGIGRSGFGLNVSLTEDRARAELYFRLGKDSDEKSKAAFAELRTQSGAIEQAFGGPLDWQELPGRLGCRICHDLPGGWKTPEGEWPALQDRLIEAVVRLERALRGPVHNLNV
jgi:hypothetical protein